MTTLQGQIDSTISLAALRRVLRAGNAHHAYGEHLRFATDVAEITFERVSEGEISIRGEAEDHGALRALAWSARHRLARADLRHRLELYQDANLMWAYFHHRWPVKHVWIGSLQRDATLAAGVADLARGAGAATALRSFDRLPIADPLAALLADVGTSHETAVWIVREDEGRELWVARESALASARDGMNVSVYRAFDDSVGRWDGKILDMREALAVAQDAFSWAHFGHRRLLVVSDTFRVRDRGVVLAPNVPLHVLGESLQQKIRVGVCTPSGQARTVDAIVTLPIVDPPAYVLILLTARKDDVPAGSEIWLDATAS